MKLSLINTFTNDSIYHKICVFKSLLRQGLLEPEFYGDLVYRLKKISGSNKFSAQFIEIISHYKKIGYNMNILQQTSCFVVNAGGSDFRLFDGSDL